MESLMSIGLVTLLLIVFGLYEYAVHQKHLSKIPIRIHVNGTRGKSSVTRLIGAGLRAGGFNTITKVTGTFPRMILGDGTEVAVHRKEKANILEQLNIVKYCANQGADVLLIECMALNPIYQRITEHQMIKATHGVITNIRLDHLDVMGPGLQNVADALSLTVPRKSQLFTSEDRMLGFLRKKAAKLKTDLHVADGSDVSEADMHGFTYFEHPQNVSLALRICASLNIDRAKALAAMKRTIPDEGALRKFSVSLNGHPVHFYNALAANDPESSLMLWDNIQKMESGKKDYLMLI
ncbi:MAG: poly-gamma-glutamate synthase PgsB, partial [Bacteroidota bacterium]